MFFKKHSRVRNDAAGCGGGLANLTDCSHLCLPSCYRNDKSTRKPAQVTHNYLYFTRVPPDCDAVIEDQMGSKFQEAMCTHNSHWHYLPESTWSSMHLVLPIHSRPPANFSQQYIPFTVSVEILAREQVFAHNFSEVRWERQKISKI